MLEKLRMPSLFDVIILATARALDAKLVTRDEYFKGMDEIIWIGQLGIMLNFFETFNIVDVACVPYVIGTVTPGYIRCFRDFLISFYHNIIILQSPLTLLYLLLRPSTLRKSSQTLNFSFFRF
ncbi:MAG: hypothetical protein QW424_03385 [Candidatus Bathyarchaeia archaeon]